MRAPHPQYFLDANVFIKRVGGALLCRDELGWARGRTSNPVGPKGPEVRFLLLGVSYCLQEVAPGSPQMGTSPRMHTFLLDHKTRLHHHKPHPPRTSEQHFPRGAARSLDGRRDHEMLA